MAKYQGKRSAGSSRSDHRRQQKRGHGALAALAVILVVLLLAAAAILLQRPEHQQGNSQPEDTAAQPAENAGTEEAAEPPSEQAQEQETGLSFPCTPEGSGLEITSLFSSDIFNPDGGNAAGESLASLELTNLSGDYLTQGSVTVTLTDGTVYTFEICDLPAGGQMMAFSPENAAYDGKTGCESITASTQFAEGDQLMAGQVSFEVEGTTVTLTNLTQEELGPLTVVCHDSLDEAAFGGVSYAYPVEGIPAGGSVTVDAIECMLGQATVVRIMPEN
ncbi:MAG: hypothetical protein ACI3VN_01745 [Candidatus Onthomonas sp.]